MFHLQSMLPAELAHALAPLGLRVYSEILGREDEKLFTWQPLHWRNLFFRNRIGTAGGIDKNADCIEAWTKLGAGFVEVGTVTPLPQKANPGKIMARDWEAQNLWNRMGFPNDGVKELCNEIKFIERRVPIFINIGKNRQTPIELAVEDYCFCVDSAWDVADCFTVNISSPNTTDLRTLQTSSSLQSFCRDILLHAKTKPVLLKLSPDLSETDLRNLISTAAGAGVSGFILTNTTLMRPKESNFPKEGGLSGKALAQQSQKILSQVISELGTRRSAFLIVSAGGIMSSADAINRLQLGADLLQVYSALVFKGPGFFRELALSQRKSA